MVKRLGRHAQDPTSNTEKNFLKALSMSPHWLSLGSPEWFPLFEKPLSFNTFCWLYANINISVRRNKRKIEWPIEKWPFWKATDFLPFPEVHLQDRGVGEATNAFQSKHLLQTAPTAADLVPVLSGSFAKPAFPYLVKQKIRPLYD